MPGSAVYWKRENYNKISINCTCLQIIHVARGQKLLQIVKLVFSLPFTTSRIEQIFLKL